MNKVINGMKKIGFSLLIFVATLLQPALSQEITEQSFKGQWCGKWDNIYSFCLTIDKIDKDAHAKYRWLEHPQGKYKKDTKKIERVNRNTLKIDNIWFALNENDLNQANSMGVFRIQSRTAVLEKQAIRRLE